MNLTGEMNIQQIEACLKNYDTWGNKHIINICSGQTDVIPWGIGDFFGVSMLAIFCLIMVLLILLLIVIIIKTITGSY